MRYDGKIVLTFLSLALCVNIATSIPISAQGTVSTETTIETRGVGFKGANVFNPKYKERIGTYTEQIEMGRTKGWLTAQEVEQFSARLEGMKKAEADAAASGWIKADVDAIDKLFTQFNMDLHKASNKPAPAATTTPAASAPEPAGAEAGGDPKAAPKTTTTTKKPAAKAKAPAKKPVPKKTSK